jgi:hypothetical protein
VASAKRRARYRYGILTPASTALALAVFCQTPPAQADSLFGEPTHRDPEFATPPDAALEAEPRGAGGPLPELPPESNVRVGVGPALRLAEEGSGGGLWAGVDIGRSAGIRLVGQWTDSVSGQSGSASHYGADLWLDLAPRARLKPVVGAGAVVARTSLAAQNQTLGAAMLRGELVYHIPGLDTTDARAALSAVGFVPAIEAGEAKPWATLTLGLLIGI